MKTTSTFLAIGLLFSAACAEQSSELSYVTVDGLPTLSEDERTFEVVSVQSEADAVVYTVVNSSQEIRTLAYTDTGLTGVFDEAGTLVAGAGVANHTLADGILASLNLPRHPVHGYAALEIDRPLPLARPAVDAQMPAEMADQAYAADCSRTSVEWTGSDGCTYGVFIDSCDDADYWGAYQKKSGCFLGYFNCDCAGGYDGGVL